MDSLWQDIRYGVRTLSKRPGLTLVAIITLALGIGANTVIFGVLNALLLRPLAYKDSRRLVMIWETNPRFQTSIDGLSASALNFTAWRDQNHSFENISALSVASFILTGTGEPERISNALVSASFFSVMGVEPILGRFFTPEDEKTGANKVAVISHSLWQRRFNSSPDIVGKVIALNGEGYTLVGVAPEEFNFPRPKEMPDYVANTTKTELWVPLDLADPFISMPGAHLLSIIARLKPEVTLEQADSEMSALAFRLAQEYPRTNEGFGAKVVSLNEQTVGNVRLALIVLMAVVGFVLLIACANVANLLLARSSSPRREIAVRMAMGATRRRVIRQLLTEALLLSVMGGAVGIVLAILSKEMIIALASGALPRLDEISIDGRVLSFTLVILLATSLLCGILPAFQSSNFNISGTIRDGAGGVTGFRGKRMLSLLVVIEFALSMVLLIGAGLTIRSFAQLLNLKPGFDSNQVAAMNISLPTTGYKEGQQKTAFFKQVFERVSALPGVQSCGGVSELPLSGYENICAFILEGKPLPKGSETPFVDRRIISPNYFRTMRIPLLSGRDFTEADNDAAPGVVIVSERWAQLYLPDEDPIGKRIRIGGPASERPWLTIVGVVGDVKHKSIDSEIKPQIYWSYLQTPHPFMTLVVRSAFDLSDIIAAVRGEVWAVDKDQAITDVKLMEQYVSNSLSRHRLNMALFSAFAALALILAAVGIYGVMSYSVTQRTREMGVRMALGAEGRDLIKMVIRQGMTLAITGVIIGLAASLGFTRVLSSLLYGVDARDPMTFAGIAIFLTLVAIAACYIPARRATKVNPMTALRHE